MNCTTVQHRLLDSECLEPPPGELESHLARCPACRDCLQRLVHVERHISNLPVPSSWRDQLLIRALLDGTALPLTRMPSPRKRFHLKERGLQKLALALALAATLAAFALGWWLWPHHQVIPHPGPVDPLVQRQADRDQRLAAASTPRERVQKLALLAEELQVEFCQHHQDTERLDVLARFYREVVCEDLVRHARALSPQERTLLLPTITGNLRSAESEASRLAAEHPESAPSLLVIARAASEGERSLRDLLV
jgi:hypothetical protein